MKKTGLFITFEGTEGSGKSTQVRRLTKCLETQGYPVLLTREPGGTPLADKLRSILLDANNKHITSEEELFLYEIARRDHVSEVIRPALKKGMIVLCDRFTDATMAYQGFGRGLSKNKIEALNEAATGGLKPDKTFVFDLPVRTGLKRARNRCGTLDRLEQEKLNFHERVRQGYLTLARKEKKRICVLDARKPIGTITHELLSEMEKCLRRRIL